jgi:hypothetical protein
MSVDMPITTGIYRVIHEDADPFAVVTRALAIDPWLSTMSGPGQIIIVIITRFQAGDMVKFSQWNLLLSRSAHELAKKMGVDMPITTGIYRVIHEDADPLAVVTEVMTRDLGPEVDSTIIAAAKNSPAAVVPAGMGAP